MSTEASCLTDVLITLCRQPRPAGSAANAAVRDWLMDQYRGMGYEVELDASPFVGWELLAPPRVEYLSPLQRPLVDCWPVVWSGSTDGEVAGAIRPGAAGLPATLRTFEAYDWDLYPVVDAGGAVVSCLLSGANVWPQPRDDERDPMPCVLVGAEEGRLIQRYLAARTEVVVRVSVASRYVPGQMLTNIIAHAGQSGPAVLVGAHYDSFFTTTGAHDNASGTAVLVGLERRLSAERRPGVRFVSFDAEEWNKLGSYRYVAELERRGELKDVRAYLNIDSVGVGEAIYLATTPAHGRSLERALRGRRGRPVHVDTSGGLMPFDAWPFARRGVPAVQVGTFGRRPFRAWHRPEDSLDYMGPGGMELIGDVIELVHDLLNRDAEAIWSW